MSELTIREATTADAAACVEIYAPIVEQTTTSFETEVPAVDEFAKRMRRCIATHAWLVAELDGRIVGYAYGGTHRTRAAYQWSAEVSAYVREGFRRRGVARSLYAELFDRLRERGYCNAFAGITLPNDSSVAMHVAMGFSFIGVYHKIGFKFDQWCDVAWYELRLRDVEHPPQLT